MGLYNFQKRFLPMIQTGTKTHTIRAARRHADKAGNTLHLYTGLRQRGAKLLMRVPCTNVQEILITEQKQILIDGMKLSPDECESLARMDGFANFDEMMRFWDGKRPFAGHVIHWE